MFRYFVHDKTFDIYIDLQCTWVQIFLSQTLVWRQHSFSVWIFCTWQKVWCIHWYTVYTSPDILFMTISLTSTLSYSVSGSGYFVHDHCFGIWCDLQCIWVRIFWSQLKMYCLCWSTVYLGPDILYTTNSMGK